MSALGKKDRLSRSDLKTALEVLPAWSLSGDGLKLERTLRFEDFVSAFGFLTQVAMVAEAIDHHPEWTNVWNRVEVQLITHAAGGVTVRDLGLARKIDEIAARFALSCDPGGGDCGGCS